MQSAVLQTTNGTEWELLAGNNNNKSPKLTQRRRRQTDPQQQQQQQQHDRVKRGPVDVTAPFWQALGVTTTASSTTATSGTTATTATVKAGMSSKLRQCQKIVEIVDRLVTECRSDNNNNNNVVTQVPTAGAAQPQSQQYERISVVDMGCGRGYLTFALHSFLHQKYGTAAAAAALRVQSRGIDERPKLVREIAGIARSLSGSGDGEFEALHFETGTIESFLAESSSSSSSSTTTTTTTAHEEEPKRNSLDILIALHACDTATDDALWSGIARNASIIVVAPCCHRQVRPQLNRHAAADQQQHDHPYADVWRHGIYRERVAETVTDSVRALLLELAGYTVQVFEFIGGEHTSKNVMITAVKTTNAQTQTQTQQWSSGGSASNTTTTSSSREERLYERRLERIRGLAKFHGIRDQKLAEWMRIRLSDDEPNGAHHRKPLSARTMPPLKK